MDFDITTDRIVVVDGELDKLGGMIHPDSAIDAEKLVIDTDEGQRITISGTPDGSILIEVD